MQGDDFDDLEERTNLLVLVARATDHIEALRKFNKVLYEPGHDDGERCLAVFQQCHIAGELDLLLAAMERRLTGATAH